MTNQHRNNQIQQKQFLKMASKMVESKAGPTQIYKFDGIRRYLDADAIFEILRDVLDLPIAIISMNGNKRTGKSFMLNFLLSYAANIGSANWFDKVCNSTEYGFEWKAGSKSTTIGMWMWSKPFIITGRSGQKIAVILMDTQGSFDQQTDFRDNALMFCLSVWMSSNFIYNVQGQLDEDKLQFLEYFTDYASLFSSEVADVQMSSTEPTFQDMTFLMRDWHAYQDHRFGLHSRSMDLIDRSVRYAPSNGNFVKDFLSEDAPELTEEAKTTRRDIFANFCEIQAFLLPYPGKGISQNYDHKMTEMDIEFSSYLNKFVVHIFNENVLRPKKMHGTELTGRAFVSYVKKWAELIAQEIIPDVKNLGEATAEVHLTMLSNRLEKSYRAKIYEKAKTGMPEKEFERELDSITVTILEEYRNLSLKYDKYEKKLKLSSKLQEQLRSQCYFFVQMNIDSIAAKRLQELYDEMNNDLKINNQKIELQQKEIERTEMELKNTQAENRKDRERLESHIGDLRRAQEAAQNEHQRQLNALEQQKKIDDERRQLETDQRNFEEQKRRQIRRKRWRFKLF